MAILENFIYLSVKPRVMSRGYYISRYAYNSRRSVVWKGICKFLQSYIPKDSVILDLGCGYGDFINNIRGGKRYALDISAVPRKSIQKGISFHQGTSTKLPYKKDFFDVVFCSNLFEHLKREELYKTISEVRRVLKLNGSLLILQPNYKYCVKDYFDDYTHELVFTHVSLKDFLEANGLRVKHCKKRLLPFNVSDSSIFPVFLLSFLVKMYLFLPVKPFAKQMFMVAINKK